MMVKEPTDCPYYLISRASLAVTALLKRELTAAGMDRVRPSYLGVLMSLWQEDSLKGVDLARRAGLEPSTMTALLDRMEHDGLLARTPDPEDRRAQRICLTAEGRRARASVLALVEKTLEKVLQGVPEPDLTRMKKTLRHVLENTDKMS